MNLPIPADDPLSRYEDIKQFRHDLKPIQIIQPKGVSFKVEDNLVTWNKWKFRVGFTDCEGAVIYLL